LARVLKSSTIACQRAEENLQQYLGKGFELRLAVHVKDLPKQHGLEWTSRRLRSELCGDPGKEKFSTKLIEIALGWTILLGA